MQDINWSDPQTIAAVVVFGVFILTFGIEIFSGRIGRGKRPMRDLGFTLVGITSQVAFSGALIGSLAATAAIWLWPQHANAMIAVPFWIAFLVIFVTEELLHYVIHRYAHEWRWLWKIHRTHHSGLDLNIGVTYRYNIFWVLMLPQAWMGAFAIYLGQGWAYVCAIIITFIVNVATHCNARWDMWLRNKYPWIEPFWRVFEKIITTPDAHHAHHAYGKTGHTNGNYAVTLFIFDIMFGTAKLPNSKQTNYGLPISQRLHWAEELLWPLIKKPLAEKKKAVNVKPPLKTS